jgi:hypothetical protein
MIIKCKNIRVTAIKRNADFGNLTFGLHEEHYRGREFGPRSYNLA